MPKRQRTPIEIQRIKTRLRKIYFKRFKRFTKKSETKDILNTIHENMRNNINDLLLSFEKSIQDKKIMAYEPFSTEPPVLNILETLNLNVYYPKIEGSILKAVSSNKSEERNISEMDIIIVPGLFVTKEGCRLGRGKGYYDRTLKLAPHIKTIFLCYSWQILRALPIEEHDIRIKIICSEKDWFLCI
ncbi:MAG: 5-formyltetrahydrofolate cyclo-ligase [Spirochaetia bacterium]|nr:5-formyltetrahydrofolate cyclo-ligase [Spirochaetia bacterium]